MPKYKDQVISKDTINTERGAYDVTTKVDSLGYTTIELGNSFTLRLDYNNIEKLESILRTAKHKLEDNAIDQAGASPVDASYHDNPNSPVHW